jgi:hypothetical protein
MQLNKRKTDSWLRAYPDAPTKPPRGAVRKTLSGLGHTDVDPDSYPELVLHELGGEIVNSITLHELSNQGMAEWDEPVALLR